MSTKLGWFAVLGACPSDLHPILSRALASAPDDARPDSMWIRPGADACSVTILGSAYGDVAHWAQAVSLISTRTTIAFFVLEGCWGYDVFARGAHVGGMQGYPLARPELFGSVARIAKLLGTSTALLRRYERLAGEEPPNRISGDRYQASDDRAHLDFARRLGLPDPFGRRSRTTWIPEGSNASRQQWRGLRSMLKMPSERHATRKPTPLPGSRNRWHFELQLTESRGVTSVSVANEPTLHARHRDRLIALAVVKAAILRRVAQLVEHGRYPTDTVKFTCEINSDFEHRDRLLFGEPISWHREPTGQRAFRALSASTLTTLIRNGYCDPDDRTKGPSAIDWLTIMRAAPQRRAFGFAVSPKRPDYRFEVEGIDGPLSARLRQRVAGFKRTAKIRSRSLDLLPKVDPTASAQVVQTAKASAVRALAAALVDGKADASLAYVKIGCIRVLVPARA